MKLILPFVFAVAFSLSLGSAEPRRVILDTDLDSDVDDVQALAIAHALATRGEIALLGVVVTSDNPFAATCASAINSYFGQSDLPIGVLKDQPELVNRSRYTAQLSTEFPRALRSHEDALDATKLYRRLLSESPERSVTIVTLGHLTNLRNLLVSAADEYSPLSGKELIEQRVSRWICMGGRFPEGREANFYRPDPLSTVVCVREWPVAAIFCGWEVGNVIETGGAYLRSRLKPESPVFRAYELFNNFAGRRSWDQVAVLMLAEKEASAFFETAGRGVVEVREDGSNGWRADPYGRHEYVVLKPGVKPETVARLLDDWSRR